MFSFFFFFKNMFSFKLWLQSYNVKFTMLTIFNTQVYSIEHSSSVKYVHVTVQQICKTFSSYKTETVCQWMKHW